MFASCNDFFIQSEEGVDRIIVVYIMVYERIYTYVIASSPNLYVASSPSLVQLQLLIHQHLIAVPKRRQRSFRTAHGSLLWIVYSLPSLHFAYSSLLF